MRERLRSALAVAWAVALFTGLTAGVSPGEAQTDWKALDQEYYSYLRAGMYAQAEVAAQRRVDLARAQFGEGSANFALTIEGLAIVYERQGRLSEAEPLYKQVVAIRQRALGTSNAFYAASLNNLALVYQKQGRLKEALPLFEQSIAIYGKVRRSDARGLANMAGNLGQTYEKLDRFENAVQYYQQALAFREEAFGRSHVEVASSLNDLAGAYVKLKRHADAVPLYERALAVREQALSPSDSLVGTSLSNLAVAYRMAGRVDDSVALNLRAINIQERALGSDHPTVLITLGNLALAYDQKGQLAEAAQVYERILSSRNKALGPEQVEVATTLNSLARMYDRQGRYSEAISLLRRALAIREDKLGQTHVKVAETLYELGVALRAQGDTAEALPLLERALAIRQQALGPEHADVADSLSSLAVIYQLQHRNDDAEPLIRRALAIREKTLAADDSRIAASLSNLASLYIAQGNRAAAEQLLKRALAINEKTDGANHARTAHSLNNLGAFYIGQGNLAAAEPLLRRALTIREQALGPDHPVTAQSLNDLAVLLLEKGDWADAGDLYLRAMQILENRLGPDHPTLAQPLIQEARVFNTLGRPDAAQRNLQRALEIREKAFGPGHPDTAEPLNGLGLLRMEQKDWLGAAGYWRRSAGIFARRSWQGAGKNPFRSGTVRPEWVFSGLVKVGHAQAPTSGEPRAEPAREMFETAQWAQASAAAASLAQMAARSAGGSPGLAALVRERQDLVAEWQGKDKLLIAARSEPPTSGNRAGEKALGDRLAAIDARLAAIEVRLAKDFPDYAALASPKPVTVADVQSLLRDDEVLVLFLDTDDGFKPLPMETFAWVVAKGEVLWLRSELGTAALQREVAALRCGLDATAWYGEGAKRCADLLKLPADQIPKAGAPLPFDNARAHALYTSLLGEAAKLIKGKHLLVVPSGALTTLPFQVLVTKAPTSADIGAGAWLIREHAITVLPSVGSLIALRSTAKPSAAPKPMIGFANPLLEGDQTDPKHGAWYKQQAQRARAETGCAAAPKQRTAALRTLSRSASPVPQNAGLADLAHLKMQTPLPETADEVCEAARNIGADVSEMRIGARASETEVKRLSAAGHLAQYRIVHFATHGLLAGQLSGTREPGLILTPPARATAEDDGYLSGSEIASLKLDADWVVLSACNTAGGAGQGEAAEALSGLARVFFYAGARALLVSHWEVDSDAALKLVTGAVSALAKDKGLGRAEAMRRAMLAMAADTTRPKAWVPASHPAVWAPFAVVGEGGTGR